MANDISKGAMPRWQQNELNRSFGNQNATKIFGPVQSTALTTANLATASIKSEPQRSPVNFHGKSPGTAFSTYNFNSRSIEVKTKLINGMNLNRLNKRGMWNSARHIEDVKWRRRWWYQRRR